jgi:hypothetical protein
MSSKNNSIELNQSQMSALQKNSAAVGAAPSAMIGRMIDDKFGGRSVSRHGGASIKEIQKQVDSLEKMLTSVK